MVTGGHESVGHCIIGDINAASHIFMLLVLAWLTSATWMLVKIWYELVKGIQVVNSILS